MGDHVQAPAWSVDEWLDQEEQVDIVLVRADGVRITLCPDPQCYRGHVERGEVVFSPGEVERLQDAWRELGPGALPLVAGVVAAKQAIPEVRLVDGWLRTNGGT